MTAEHEKNVGNVLVLGASLSSFLLLFVFFVLFCLIILFCSCQESSIDATLDLLLTNVLVYINFLSKNYNFSIVI